MGRLKYIRECMYILLVSPLLDEEFGLLIPEVFCLLGIRGERGESCSDTVVLSARGYVRNLLSLFSVCQFHLSGVVGVHL